MVGVARYGAENVPATRDYLHGSQGVSLDFVRDAAMHCRLLALTGDYALPFTNHPSRWDIVRGEPSRPAPENKKAAHVSGLFWTD